MVHFHLVLEPLSWISTLSTKVSYLHKGPFSIMDFHPLRILSIHLGGMIPLMSRINGSMTYLIYCTTWMWPSHIFKPLIHHYVIDFTHTWTRGFLNYKINITYLICNLVSSCLLPPFQKSMSSLNTHKSLNLNKIHDVLFPYITLLSSYIKGHMLAHRLYHLAPSSVLDIYTTLRTRLVPYCKVPYVI